MAAKGVGWELKCCLNRLVWWWWRPLGDDGLQCSRLEGRERDEMLHFKVTGVNHPSYLHFGSLLTGGRIRKGANSVLLHIEIIYLIILSQSFSRSTVHFSAPYYYLL